MPGRIDHQVKIRGLRIELGEVEAAFAGIPAVREAVVVAARGTGGTKELVAYVVPREGQDQEPGGSELRRHLLESLPEYMVPGTFMTLAALPLTPNGKVDRQATPRCRPGSFGRDTGLCLPPRGPIEEAVVPTLERAAWAAAGRHRGQFFEIGGHSLLATQILARVRDMYRGRSARCASSSTGRRWPGCRSVVEQQMRAGGRLAHAADHRPCRATAPPRPPSLSSGSGSSISSSRTAPFTTCRSPSGWWASWTCRPAPVVERDRPPARGSRARRSSRPTAGPGR